jgi:hypothetical protein
LNPDPAVAIDRKREAQSFHSEVDEFLPAKEEPEIALFNRVFHLPDQMAEGTVQKYLLVLVAAAKLRRLDGA